MLGLASNSLKKELPRPLRVYMPEPAQYAYCATRDALKHAGIDQDYLDSHEVGLLYGNDSTADAVYKSISKIVEKKDTMLCGSIRSGQWLEGGRSLGWRQRDRFRRVQQRITMENRRNNAWSLGYLGAHRLHLGLHQPDDSHDDAHHTGGHCHTHCPQAHSVAT